ncbi:hypothetical protein D9M73_79940 [compost metagenome]
MPPRISVEPAGIGIEQGAYIGRLLRIIAVRGLARAEQAQGVIDLGPVRALQRTEPPARHRHRFLQRREIIFGMGIGHAVRDIGIGLAEDMRHAEAIAGDDAIVMMGGRWRYTDRHQRLPHRKSEAEPQ